ncbi:MAG: DUF4404 family protein [Gammaproteobacteria bacterium]|jgi:hypothetical protein
MPKEALRTNLDRLREELSNPDNLDEDTRRQLADIASTIDHVLEAESPDFEKAYTSVQNAALRFEASHPAFARIMSEITDALAKLGV